MQIVAHHPQQQLHRAIDAAFLAIGAVHELMSYQLVTSDVSRLNLSALAAPVRIDPRTHAILSTALDIAMRSDGAFDPTVIGRTAEFELPGGCSDIEMLPDSRVRFHRPLRIDLSGIAKGFAVDLAIEALKEAGIGSALVNAGGDLRAVGSHAFPVALRNPRAPCETARLIEVREAAVATSAAYYSRRPSAQGERSDLIDPRSGGCYLAEGSVTITAPTCLLADALTKVALFDIDAAAVLAHFQAEALYL